MKAVFIEEYGDECGLSVSDVASPEISAPEDVLIKVYAASLNRADIVQRKGLYPAPEGFPERIPGLEFAGEIVGIGTDTQGFKEGDRVFGITGGGAQAEFVKTKTTQLMHVPDNLDFIEAAAIPEAFITAFDAIVVQGKLESGNWLLIHAVGSGVGLAALQIGKVFGANTIGTSRTASKIEECKQFGLDFGIVTQENADFSKSVLELTGKQGADVILDLVGAKFLDQNLRAAANLARIVFVGLVGGNKAELDLKLVLSKRLMMIGTVLRSRSNAEKAALTARFSEGILPMFKSGELRPNVSNVFKLEEIAAAHRHLERNENLGKVVLEVYG